MKPLEEIFFRACLNEQIRILHIEDKEFDVETIANIFDRLGFSYEQLMCCVRRWSNKGFFNYDNFLDLGWFEFSKLTGEYKQIYEETSNIDGWRDGEFAKYIVKETFSNGLITNLALREELGIGKDSEFFNPYRSESNEYGRSN